MRVNFASELDFFWCEASLLNYSAKKSQRKCTLTYRNSIWLSNTIFIMSAYLDASPEPLGFCYSNNSRSYNGGTSTLIMSGGNTIKRNRILDIAWLNIHETGLVMAYLKHQLELLNVSPRTPQAEHTHGDRGTRRRGRQNIVQGRNT